MRVHELKALLSSLDDDAEVRLATQPSWPLAFHVAGVWDQAGQADECPHGYVSRLDCIDCEDDDAAARHYGEPADDQAVVWIVEGASCDSPYAPRDAWELAER